MSILRKVAAVRFGICKKVLFEIKKGSYNGRHDEDRSYCCLDPHAGGLWSTARNNPYEIAAEGTAPELRLLLPRANASEIQSALIWAARRGNRETIPLLVAAGADPNRPDGADGWGPLEYAIYTEQLDSVKSLLRSGAEVNRQDPHRRTALMLAAGYGETDIVDVLLDKGADAQMADKDGMTALDFAVLGTPDIERWTIYHCQGGTVQQLLNRAPELANPGRLWYPVVNAVKSCPDVEEILKLSQAATSNRLRAPSN